MRLEKVHTGIERQRVGDVEPRQIALRGLEPGRFRDAAGANEIGFVLDDLKLLIEPSSAVPVAAALAGRLGPAGSRLGIVLSGGNVDLGLCPFLRGDRPLM